MTAQRPAPVTGDTRYEAAMRRVIGCGYSIDFAELVVGIVLEEFIDPDRDMLDAGLADLNLALGPPPDRDHGPAYRRDLLRTIWHSMIDRAR